MEKKKGFQMPHTYIIIFGVILFAALLTVFIPLGKYDTKEITYMQNGVEKTRTVLDPESFQYILDENGNKVTKAAPIFGTEDFGGQGILNYVFEGMTVGDKNGTAVGIIAFILVVGGAFGIVLRTGAIESGIMRVIALTNGREILLIPILVVLFSLGGAVFGMGEEAIPFVMILVPMFIAMGYDAVVGIMCSYVSTPQGRQSVKKLMNHYGGKSAMPYVGAPKDFDRIAKEFHVDYAFHKVSPGHYLLFFKANQADAITAAFQKYSAKVLDKEQDKPSILGQLRKFTEQIRTQAKEKQRTREAVKDGR